MRYGTYSYPYWINYVDTYVKVKKNAGLDSLENHRK